MVLTSLTLRDEWILGITPGGAALKECPSCHRTYVDDTQTYCLDDGSVLQRYEPQPTIRIAGSLATDNPVRWVERESPSPVSAPIRAKRRWPIYVITLLLLLFIGTGLVTLWFFAHSLSQAAVSVETPKPLLQTPSPPTSPATLPTPSSKALVGTWQTDVNEIDLRMTITVTFRANGTTHYVFNTRGRTNGYDGTWEYSDETLFEKYPSGASGKSSIKWIDENTFDLTIIDNGVPAYSGRKRRYQKV